MVDPYPWMASAQTPDDTLRTNHLIPSTLHTFRVALISELNHLFKSTASGNRTADWMDPHRNQTHEWYGLLAIKHIATWEIPEKNMEV